MVLLHKYLNAFSGLRKELWWLSLITLINRAGTMVIPFLSLYLTDARGFTLSDVGWVMTAFGFGSLAGSWAGGKLTDRFGYRPIMIWSLTISGIMFILLQFVETFYMMCLGVFLIMMVADAFRPAMFVSLAAYSRPENRARAISLIRLAMNLGWTLGPACGGLLITSLGYSGLFWVDGITCILAVLVFIRLLRPKPTVSDGKHVPSSDAPKVSPYRDGPYLVFILAMTLIAFSFLQLFSTIPLFYRDVHMLSEDQIGLLMAMNGFAIFLLEMPVIKYFENPRFSVYKILIASTLMLALSFLVLNLSSWFGVLIIGMFFITFGEILNFPFGNSMAVERAQRGKQGDYMGLYSMGFAVSHIFGHNAGMQLIDNYGFTVTWYVMTAVLIIAALTLVWMKRLIEREKAAVPASN
ncbi:MAG: MFS transporter [Flavobacteriales bacterium]|nr:MFS transporter [Flavobacteriales bacterium]